MLFNSLTFILFLLIVSILFFLIPIKFRIYLIVGASLIFYGYYKPTHTIILLIVTASTFISGKLISANGHTIKRKILFVLALIIGFIPLVGYKYFNFLNENFRIILSLPELNELGILNDVVLPIGVSFYTLQAVSYLIDIYREDVDSEKNFIKYLAYLSFFPLVLAGPIERAKKLIPQLKFDASFNVDRVSIGIRRILWGFFKKIVIADKLALIINPVYASPQEYEGVILLFSAYLYAFQIYCDFSGYVDIALGIGKIFGVNLSENFNKPYNAESIKEFWHRWHITLSRWFRDYLYIPLGGKKAKHAKFTINILIVFTISGLWHGANYTFLIWGLLHGLYYLFEYYTTFIRIKIYSALKLNQNNSFYRIIKIFIIFNLVTFAWIFFRVEDLSDALLIIEKISEIHISSYIQNFSLIFQQLFELKFISMTEIVLYPLLLLTFILIENLGILTTFLDENYINKVKVSHLLLFDYLIVTLVFLTDNGTQNFIYFRF